MTGLGGIEVLVNNVGQRDQRGVDAMTLGEPAHLLDVHITSAYALSRTVAQGMAVRQVAGRIIDVSSVIGQLGRTAVPATSPTPRRRPASTG